MEITPLTWYIALLSGGFLLILAEVFIPGGIAGLFGGVALLAAMAIGLHLFPAPWGVLSAIGTIVFGGIFLLLWIQLFPRSRTGSRITLRADGAAFKSSLPPAESLVGATGEAVTALRPAGIALIQGKRYDVLADGGEWIAGGATIRVQEIRDGHLVVIEASEPA